jgi:hypothetical protein
MRVTLDYGLTTRPQNANKSLNCSCFWFTHPILSWLKTICPLITPWNIPQSLIYNLTLIPFVTFKILNLHEMKLVILSGEKEKRNKDIHF